VLVGVTDRSRQVFAHGPRTEDEQILVRRQAMRDLFDEPREMLEAVRLAGGLRWPTAAVADPWFVPNMAGCSVVSRHLGVHPLDLRLIVVPADDDRLTGVDPDERTGRPGRPVKGHTRAHGHVLQLRVRMTKGHPDRALNASAIRRADKGRTARSDGRPEGSTLEAPRGSTTIRRRGRDLIGQPLLNKGMAFTDEERDAFSLRGLLPARVMTIEEQVALELEHARRKTDDLERFIGLAALQDRNETLFYRVLAENLEEFLPIVYTPTVGRACQEFSHILRRPRGVWVTPPDIDRIDDILRTASDDDIRLIVVTDNERILGLGDQGAGGMAIPVGKLALYTAASGIYPAWTLPVSLDVGTDRVELLDDPLYLGFRSPRLRGQAYDDVVEAFVGSVRRVFPAAVLQWEDFKQHNALRILNRYRHRLPSFNDDIQGTGGVVLGGLLAARREQGGLARERFLFLGAGAAAIGIAGMLRQHLGADGAASGPEGPTIALMNHSGLVHLGRTDLAEDQLPFAVDQGWFLETGMSSQELTDPVAVARALRPTVLIGATGSRGAFSEALVREVARHSPVPIILPLSNPGDRAEARPQDILEWTDGRAIIATGSPSGDVELPGGRRTIGQANNVFIFPGVGLGAIVAEAREVTDEAFLVAARELASLVSADRLASGAMYPPIRDLRPIARTIAIAVVLHLRDRGYGRQYRDEEIAPAVDRAMWWPEYPPFVVG
jgi:malic enzyme